MSPLLSIKFFTLKCGKTAELLPPSKKEVFFDTLASLGSLLESQSVMFSRFDNILGISFAYILGIFLLKDYSTAGFGNQGGGWRRSGGFAACNHGGRLHSGTLQSWAWRTWRTRRSHPLPGGCGWPSDEVQTDSGGAELVGGQGGDGEDMERMEAMQVANSTSWGTIVLLCCFDGKI